MDWLPVFLLFYLGSNVTALHECNLCKCCKNRCQHYKGYSDICIDGCTDGYFGSRCIHACMTYCLECENKDSCTKCKNGFYLFERSCYQCPQKCLTCSSNSNCNTCTDGFYSGEWHDLSVYFYHNDCRHTCQNNCKSCTSYSSCTECKDGKYNGDHNNCSESCNSACKACTSYNKCTKCETGKYGPSCQNDCGLGCENHECDLKIGNCKCISGFQGDKCDQCVPGVYGTHCNIDCPTRCLEKYCKPNGDCYSCKSGFTGPKCENCFDGKYGNNCINHLKCKSKLNLSGGICLQCIPGYYIDNTIKTSCRACSEQCKDGICDSINGTCIAGCNDGHWGAKCESLCEKYCFKCNQVNGECSICKNGKYFKNCTKECSPNCNSTDDVIMCGIDDGACLNGCDNLKKYGKHCENDCNLNCLNISCNWKTGYCLNGCVGNFFGAHCNKACSVNCVTGGGRNCDNVKGHCIHECKDGFHGDTCEKTCSENCINKTCKKETGTCCHGCEKGFSGSSCYIDGEQQKKEETIDMNIINVIAAVTNNEILTSGHVIDHNDTGAVYAMPNKPKRNVPESKSLKETTETKTEMNPNYEKIKDDSAAVYENAVVRYSQQTAAKENVRVFVESALEIHEDLNNIAIRESKTMAQTDGACTYESEAEDTYYNVTAFKQRRIMLDKLEDVVSTKTKEDFAEEFLQLPPGLIKPYTESQKRKNAPKNRYKGIYPYDDTRVVLKEGDCDYINASYIDGYDKRRAYIASIGPTYKYMGNMSAFWKMVWQEQVGKIVMLTKLLEAGVRKCDQYWPDNDFSELYADVLITCKNEEAYADYTVRSFVAQKGSEKRFIIQVHFTAWPDKGIPDDVTSLIEFRQKVNSIKTILDRPIIVHCSAGIGRTGTYIALDSLTLEGEVEGGVDIYACVRNLREQRVNMVQTAEQYRYLHNAVVHTLTFDSKTVEATKFSEYMNTHTDAHLAENFQKLQSSVESRPDDEIEAVMKNKSLNNKNRKGADIPGDRNRPILYLDRNLGSSDYINALYVNSFKSVNRYIVAQTPMPDSVGDFLALIVQEKVTCVIDMESHVTKHDNVGAYFQADNQTLKKGTFTVISELGENTDQYIFRKLKVSHKKSEEITVKHIQFTKWDDKNDLPEDPGKFVQFIRDIVLKYCDSEKEGPILVHCLTGAEKSGLLCAVSVLLEKTQIDQEISVVNTVRQIKYRRHMSVPNKEQYIFCHQCLNEYLRSFDTYSNFGLKV